MDLHIGVEVCIISVSYTHLDVYKRQVYIFTWGIGNYICVFAFLQFRMIKYSQDHQTIFHFFIFHLRRMGTGNHLTKFLPGSLIEQKCLYLYAYQKFLATSPGLHQFQGKT